jgi:hypothetical protein
MDSKHRMLMNNYPVTAVGVLDAGQQFNLIALAVSNKEDENMYSAFIQGIETVLQSIGVRTDPECAMSDNSDAIQKSFMRYCPNTSIGGCFFHVLQNIKKKRSLWNIYVPTTISSTLKSRFVIRARDSRERFAQEALRWLSALSFIHEFTLFSDIFLQMLHAQGDQVLSDTLRAEYFQGFKRGWARCMMPCGSAGTNNSLEAFNGSVLEKDIVAGSRMTMALFLESVEGLLRQQSEIFTEKSPPLTPLDVRRTVRASSHMKQRVKAWYAKEMALDDDIAKSSVPFHSPDGHGGFYLLSAASRRSGHHIDDVLNGQQSRIEAVMMLCSEASAFLNTWTTLQGSVASQLFESIFKRLKDAVTARDTSFYHVRLIPPVLNKSLLQAKRVANEIISSVVSDEQERTAARIALNNDGFLWMGVTTHSCTCAQFYSYNACKHVIWATITTTGQLPPLNVIFEARNMLWYVWFKCSR